MTVKEFPLADALTVTTGKLLSRRHMDGVYQILNFMTQDSLFTHQLPRACDAMQPVLLEQHPWLAGLNPPDGIDTTDLFAWLADMEAQHPGAVVVTAAPDQWQRRDPLAELDQMAGNKPVIAVHVDSETP